MDLIILQSITYILVFFLGASLGSFGLVVVRRGHNDDWTSWLTGKSFCESCNKTLKWWELIPFVSYIVLGGKCSKCKAKIDPSHFFAETICGVIYLVLYLLFHTGFMSIYHFVAYAVICTVMWLLSVSDFLYREINVLPIYVLAALVLVLNGVFNGGWIKLIVMVVLFVLIGFIGRNDSFSMIGSGDLDYILLIACLLPNTSFMYSVMNIVDVVVYACFAGIFYFLVYGIRSKEKKIPFVPCLTFGYVLAACGVSLVGRLYEILTGVMYF